MNIEKTNQKTILTGKMSVGKTSHILDMVRSGIKVLLLLPNVAKVVELSSVLPTVTGKDSKEYKEAIFSNLPDSLATTIDFYLVHRDKLKDYFDVIVVDEAHVIVTDSTFRERIADSIFELLDDVNMFVTATPEYIQLLLDKYGYDYEVKTIEGKTSIDVRKISIKVSDNWNKVVAYLQRRHDIDYIFLNNKDYLNYFADRIKIYRGNIRDRWRRLKKYDFDVKFVSTSVMNCGVNIDCKGQVKKVAIVVTDKEDVYNVIQMIGRFRHSKLYVDIFVVKSNNNLFRINDVSLFYHKVKRTILRNIDIIEEYFDVNVDVEYFDYDKPVIRQDYNGLSIDFKPIGRTDIRTVVYNAKKVCADLYYLMKQLPLYVLSKAHKKFLDAITPQIWGVKIDLFSI